MGQGGKNMERKYSSGFEAGTSISAQNTADRKEFMGTSV